MAIKGSGSYFYMQAGGKEKGKYLESMQSSTTHDLCHPRKHHTQENQEASPIPTSDHEARQYNKKDKRETYITKRIHNRSTAIKRSVIKLLEGLNSIIILGIT